MPAGQLRRDLERVLVRFAAAVAKEHRRDADIAAAVRKPDERLRSLVANRHFGRGAVEEKLVRLSRDGGGNLRVRVTGAANAVTAVEIKVAPAEFVEDAIAGPAHDREGIRRIRRKERAY